MTTPDLVVGAGVGAQNGEPDNLAEVRPRRGIDQAFLQRDLFEAGPEREEYRVDPIERAVEHGGIVESAGDDIQIRRAGRTGKARDRLIPVTDERPHRNTGRE